MKIIPNWSGCLTKKIEVDDPWKGQQRHTLLDTDTLFQNIFIPNVYNSEREKMFDLSEIWWWLFRWYQNIQ